MTAPASTANAAVSNIEDYTKNQKLIAFILDRIKTMQPSRVHLCDGSEAENEHLLKLMVQSGTIIPVNPDIRPNSYLARSSPEDVARVEERTFICTDAKDDAGPLNNWEDPENMTATMTALFDGSMRGRCMYVVPYVMGPLGSPFSKIGIQLTDSPFVVANMRIMTKMGKDALDMLGDDGEFIPCVHSVGAPLTRGQPDTTWPCNPDNKYIVHFPEQRRIWSYGSGYGGNAILAKKCLSLRLASYMAKEEGWLAEHMLIVGVTNPQGVKKYFAAAFPSACGKTNLAMMTPRLPGWKVECVGDDIAWIRIGADGRLYAVNPEAGFFGVAPGTSMDSNPNAMLSLQKNVLFTNVAMKSDGDVWWEGMTKEVPSFLTSWLRTEHYPDSDYDAAHPNARFTVSARQCPVLDENYDNPAGVPLSGIIFGGRRSQTIPLVYQARDWQHGVFVGANMNSETTAAASGKRGVLRPDPFAMKPFCGYNINDYFAHWLSFSSRTDESKLPKIFHVNWFRKSVAGKFLWPGFGDNARVLEWIFNRCEEETAGHPAAVDTPLGLVPTPESLNTSGLTLPADDLKELLSVDPNEIKAEVHRSRLFFKSLGSRLPSQITQELDNMEKQVAN